MLTKDVQILCVGNNPNLLLLRCAVLEAVGYKTRMSPPGEAASLLLSEIIDLIVFSAEIREYDTKRILAVAGDTPSIVLEVLTFPRDLLARVSGLMRERARVPHLVKNTQRATPGAGSPNL